MLRPVLGIAAAGFLGVLLWKILGVILLPVFASLVGLVLLLVKLALVVALVMFVVWFFKKREGGKANAD